MRDLTVSELERLAVEAGVPAARSLGGGVETDVADVVFQMDEEAFRAFYDRTARALWSYLARVAGDRQLADDLLQETYYRFLRARRAYESEDHRRNSLFRIATNLVIDIRRRVRVEVPASDEHTRAYADGDVADRAVCQTDVRRALTRLKPRERALLWLAYAQGASHREIADVLGVKRASIKLMLFRARRRFADVLRGRQGRGSVRASWARWSGNGGLR